MVRRTDTYKGDMRRKREVDLGSFLTRSTTWHSTASHVIIRASLSFCYVLLHPQTSLCYFGLLPSATSPAIGGSRKPPPSQPHCTGNGGGVELLLLASQRASHPKFDANSLVCGACWPLEQLSDTSRVMTRHFDRCCKAGYSCQERGSARPCIYNARDPFQGTMEARRHVYPEPRRQDAPLRPHRFDFQVFRLVGSNSSTPLTTRRAPGFRGGPRLPLLGFHRSSLHRHVRRSPPHPSHFTGLTPPPPTANPFDIGIVLLSQLSITPTQQYPAFADLPPVVLSVTLQPLARHHVRGTLSRRIISAESA
ncbi:hypothetical protein CPAR01_08569 [Colletotrichum paranaense]|uniref:Uncharacterized protein n=1 Tax=Colletotrichum paranaense TaxID=1914294 RepID=A0ABQ9SKN9_9PEZI|nr:uncharacterized protein CPAR01_08569 [Colletotrichum paranaense]KAK1538456.1 hypothetical protein CPAR01_08569 [Colletotrichum paranaense]